MTGHPAPPWLTHVLCDPAITDICLNGANEAFVDAGHGMQPLLNAKWSMEDMRMWILDQLSQTGKSWDARYPFVDSTLASGHRLHAAFPPLARQGIVVSLRRLPRPHEARWGNARFFELLKQAITRGESILISGATGSGKTTLANDLLACVPPHERIIALEDTSELAPRHPHFVSLLARPPNADGFGEITLRTLLKQALRMRPDRLILGECRGAEVLDLLQALNTGHRGALATLHANSPREALKRIELLCLLSAGGAIPLAAIREFLALGVQWVAHVRREGPERFISEVMHLEGREGDSLLMRSIQ